MKLVKDVLRLLITVILFPFAMLAVLFFGAWLPDMWQEEKKQ